MPSFKNQEPMIELPKLISLDIIDLNKRLRKRKNKIESNLWDLLPDDVMPNIVKYKVKMDFDDNKYNRLFNQYALFKIANELIENNNWNYKFIDPNPYDDCNYYYRIEKAKLDFVKEKLNDSTKFDYLNYFKTYIKKEKATKKFEIGNTFNRTFKSIKNNEKKTITITFIITDRKKIHENYEYFVAKVSGTDVYIKSNIILDWVNISNDDNYVYYKEFSTLDLRENNNFNKYMKDNNLYIIRYRLDC